MNLTPINVIIGGTGMLLIFASMRNQHPVDIIKRALDSETEVRPLQSLTPINLAKMKTDTGNIMGSKHNVPNLYSGDMDNLYGDRNNIIPRV